VVRGGEGLGSTQANRTWSRRCELRGHGVRVWSCGLLGDSKLVTQQRPRC
jgi:hypothetical protein